jgi:hypothetical protein
MRIVHQSSNVRADGRDVLTAKAALQTEPPGKIMDMCMPEFLQVILQVRNFRSDRNLHLYHSRLGNGERTWRGEKDTVRVPDHLALT